MMPARQWSTPLTIGSFVLMAVTGVLMFFHVDSGLNAGAHEWCAWLFMIGVAGHVTANFRPFKHHVKSGLGRASVALFMLLLGASFFAWGVHTGAQLLAAIRADLIGAPLSTLALIRHTTPEQLQRSLQAHGISASKEQTVRQIAGPGGGQQLHVLELVFLP